MTNFYDPVVSVKANKYYLRILNGDKVHTGIWFKAKKDMESFATAITNAVALAPEMTNEEDMDDDKEN